MFVNLSLIKFLANLRDYYVRHSFWINSVSNLGIATANRDVWEQLR